MMGAAEYEELIAYPEVLQNEGMVLWLRMLDVHDRVLRLRGEGWSPELISSSCGVPMDLVSRIEAAGPLPEVDIDILLEALDGPD